MPIRSPPYSRAGPDGTVKAEQKISATEGNLPVPLLNGSVLGVGVGFGWQRRIRRRTVLGIRHRRRF